MTSVFALLRLLPVSDRDKDTEILALRHQITVLERQLGTTRPRFSPADRAFLAALLHRLPRDVLGRFRLLIHPDTVLALAPGPAGPPPRGQVPPPTSRPAAHRPLHPPAGPAPGTREPELGLPAHSRRAPRPRHHHRRLHRLGDPARRRDRPCGCRKYPPRP